jgi:glucuronate isomerase
LREDKYYAAFLAGGYLKYLNDSYKNLHASYTAYSHGINGRLEFFRKHGHFRSKYALEVLSLIDDFSKNNH